MMQRRTFVAMAAAAGTALVAPVRGFAQAEAKAATPTTETTPQSGYAPVNGLQMYYEIHGAGEPLVLLHGAFGAIDLWGPILTTLAETHQVIAVELQGHGHTADIIDRPLGYEQMADDVAALMDHLGIAQADIVGYSMGGTTGLQLAIRHPDLVRTLVAVSPNYRSDGYYPELLAGLLQMTPDIFVGTPEEAAYLRHAPHPEDFPVLVEKQKVLPQDVCLSGGGRRGDRGTDAADLRRFRCRPSRARGGALPPPRGRRAWRSDRPVCPALSWPSSPAPRTARSWANAPTGCWR